MAPVQDTGDDTTCPEGASKIFECQVIGLPRPSVRWYKDGVNITANSRYKFEYTPDGCVVLVLENVTADDQGIYSCRAQNSEGSAETTAQLYIKDTMSAADKEIPSVHAMSSFKRIETEEEMTSQSRRRPLVVGSSGTTDSNDGYQSELQEESLGMSFDVSITKTSEGIRESVEKGIREIEQQYSFKESKKKHDIGYEMENEFDEETQKNDECLNDVDDLLELTQFGRRLTTDSGITSRGSSFSSEPDTSFTEESFKEMKEYLHGKADALYQPFEQEKLKDIKESEVKIIEAQSTKHAKREKAEQTTKQIMGMANLRKEKYDLDRVNELEASVLAGMYLFDNGPADPVDAHRHGIPALELLVRKEALENIPDKEVSAIEFEQPEVDSNIQFEKSRLNVEYQTAEIIQQSGTTVESVDVEKLNAINIERSNEILRKHKDTKFMKAKVVSCVEDEEEDVKQRETDKYIDDNTLTFSKTKSLNEANLLAETKTEIGERSHKKKREQTAIGDSTDEVYVDINAVTSSETTDGKIGSSRLSITSELDNDSEEKDASGLDIDASVENENLENTPKDEHFKDTDSQKKTERDLDKFETNFEDNASAVKESGTFETDKDFDRNQLETKDDSNLFADDTVVSNDFNQCDADKSIDTSSKNESLDTVSKMAKARTDEEKRFCKEKIDNTTTSDSTNEDCIDSNAVKSCDTMDTKVESSKPLSLPECDKHSKEKNDRESKKEYSVESAILEDTSKEKQFNDSDSQCKTDKRIDTDETSDTSANVGVGINSSKNDSLNQVPELTTTKTEEEEEVRHQKGDKTTTGDNTDKDRVDSDVDASCDAIDAKQSSKSSSNVKTSNVSERKNDMELNTNASLENEIQEHDINENHFKDAVSDAETEGLLDTLETSLEDNSSIFEKECIIQTASDLDRGHEQMQTNKSRKLPADADDVDVTESLMIQRKEQNGTSQEETKTLQKFDSVEMPLGRESQCDSLLENERTEIDTIEQETKENDKVFKTISSQIDDSTSGKKEDNKDSLLRARESPESSHYEQNDVLDGKIKLSGHKEKHEYRQECNDELETNDSMEDEKVVDKKRIETYKKKTNEDNVCFSDSANAIDSSFDGKIMEGHTSVAHATSLDELNRAKDDQIEGSSEKNTALNDAAEFLVKESNTTTETPNVKQVDEKKENAFKLYSANEDSDAGIHYTEPLKDSDLVYLDDTHPEIPNVIHIVKSMKEKDVGNKSSSLTDEIENRAMTLKDISEKSALVASVKETQATKSLMAKSVDELNLVSLEDEKSLVENITLSKIADTETSISKRVSEQDVTSIENTVETKTFKIKETIEIDEKEVSEEQLLNVIANTDNTPPNKDTSLALDAHISTKETVVEQEVLEEKPKIESDGPAIESHCDVEAKSSDILEEAVVPKHVKKDEELPDFQNFNKTKNNATDKTYLDKSERLAEEDTKLLELHIDETLSDEVNKQFKDQKMVSVEDAQTKPDKSVDKAADTALENDKIGEKENNMEDNPNRPDELVGDTTDTKLELGKSELTVVVLLNDNNVQVPEGLPVKLHWKISGVELSTVSIYKDGQKVKFRDNFQADIVDDVYTLTVDKVTVEDEATYSVRTQGSEIDHGEVRVKVTTSEGEQSTVPREPQFIVEPVVEVEDGRRLSIKCSVTGFPSPEVTWYHHGQQLSQSALWDIYCKDGCHYLTVSDPSILDCEEIVCQVENDLGYVQRVITVKRDGDEVYCEPVLPPVSPEPVEDTELSPRLEIEISEIVTTNLRQLPLACEYTDRLNFVTLNAGDIVEILACEAEDTVLARNMPQKEKVCYIPKQALVVGRDVSGQVCENAAVKNNIALTEQQLVDNKEEATMPERRKMKSPSPKMTSTPKMKRKEMDTESTEELQKRLGYSDNLAQRKEFSTPDSVEFTEYNDGTTRPMFKKRLKSVTAKSGETAQIECTVSGSPLPKILWLKNNRPLKASDGCKVIVDEGTNILVFPKAKEEDVGIYTARAMNVNGSIMCSAEFTLSDGRGLPAQPVTDSPMDMDFTTPAYFFQMSSCEVSEGRLARFDCRVVAYPKPEIVWMRDGKVIEAEQRFKLLNFNNEIYSLLVQDVRIEDTGRYTCWARNKFGEAMTEAYLNVIALSEQEPEGDLAPKFLTRFYDQQTTEGTATDFKCLIAGRPEPSVTWLLDDLEIREEKGVRMRHKDGMVSLEIKTPKVDQSGTYTCQLSNQLGEATCSARLTVVEDKLHGKMLPKFLKKFDHVTVKEGEEAKFTSVIVGEPRPDVVWLFDHKPISDTNRRFVVKKEGDAYTLIIKNVRFDDAGKITCKASNEEGEVYCSANLHVRESKYMRDLPEKTGVKSQDEIDAKFGYVPTFTRRLQDLEVKEGSRATFECKVMGIPDPEISWMKDGRVITPSGRYRMTFEGGFGQLMIDNVSAADTGVYTCIVSNSQGKSSSTAALKLEEPKKERYTPDRLLEERTSRKERYTPDKYLLDDSTSAKRPYLDTDRYDAAKVRKSYESPLTTTKLEDAYLPRPKKKYDSPKSSYESFKPRYDTSYESPKRTYESPLKQFDSAYSRLESPVRQYDTYTRYESPVRQYESVSTKYESPVRPYESISTRYDSPIRQFDSGYTRYESPVRMYDTSRTTYESPRRRSSVGREEKIKAIPKIPFDRPALLNKHDDSVQLSWLPAPTYSLPDDARHVSYVIESREVPGRDWTKVAASVPGTSYTVRHLRPDKEYEFRVRAQNQHGVSEPTWNATLDKRVDETSKQLDMPEMRAPPRLPTHRPIITDLGEETMRLAWRPVETYQARRAPPVSYRLEAKELPGKDWMPLSSRLRDTTHYLSDLPHDRDYMIRVRAENDFGISEPTEPLWIPRATAFPGVPITRPQIIDYEDTMAKLSWSRVDIPSFGLDDTPLLYMLEVEEPPHKDWRTIARDLDDTEYMVEGLKPGHDYRFRVRAKTPTGIVSEPSPAVSLYTKLAQTRSPVDRLEVLDYEPDSRSVNLSWDRVNIPPYNVDEEPLMYMLEYQEPPLPDWKTLVTGIPTTRYRVMHLDRDRDYNFRVRALTPYGVSPPSPSLPVTMRQTPVTRGLPEKVVISEVDAHSLRLTWRRPMYDLDKPINYQVEMLESPFSDWRPIATRVPETNYKVTGLKPTRDYQFRVIPQVDTEYLAPSSSAALTTLPVRPRLPYAEPRLKELTPESVQLSWGSAELPAYQRKRSPIHYKVEMAELPSSNWVPVTRKVTDTSYTVTGLRPNQEYKFRVFAESDSGLSEPSMPTTLYRRPAPRFPLKEPTIRDLSQNVVHLTWTPAEIPDSTEGVSYMVEMQTPPGIASWNALYRQHPTPSVRLADLRPDLDYLVRVRAQSGTYLSEPTLPVYIPRRAAPPRLPVEEPYAVEINPDFVKIQWRSADLPTHIQDYAHVTYKLEAQELPDTNWVTITRGIPHTDFKVTGLNPQRDYNFRVRAENEYGLSDPTHPMMIRKRAVAPVMPSYEPMLYDIGAGSARLSWRPATLPSFMPSQSPITYTLFVQDLPYKTWRPLVKGIPHTSYYVSGLQPDKEYMFRVQAENQYGSSRPTDAACLPRFKDFTRPISVPEVSDFDEDLTSVKLRWMPNRTSPLFDTTPRKYTIETYEPVRREWKPVARGVPDTTYQIRGLPKLPDHLFRVRMDTEEPTLSEPSMPVSLSRYSLPRAPLYRPQLYELEDDSVRLSWQPAHVPEGVSRRSVRYTIEQREIPEPRWSPIATDIIETSYKVRGLRSKCDYEFRVKAMYDGISTEPSYPVSLFRRAVIPKVRLDAPEVYDVEDESLSLRWKTVDVPAFTPDEEPLLFVIERQTLPSYEWQPVATNITDKSYTVKDLKPYQDYNFRVRGVYPSGYTEPSPNVPVYRRPSESKIGLVGLESSTLDFKGYSSQKYSSKIASTKTLPTKSLHATLPTELSPITKKAIETRLRSYSSSPQRRYSVANIYDTREVYSKEADFKKAPVPEPKFKLENAYVYNRSRSPVKVDLPTVYEHLKAGGVKKVTPKKENDLYAWYQQMHRRYSDAGIEELTRRRSRKSVFIEEKIIEDRRAEHALEAQQRRLQRRGSLPSVPTVKSRMAHPTQPSVGYPSVADRYEDIKCPHIVSPGHWRFARRHSVALDWEDLQRIQRQLQAESKRLETKRRTRSEMPKTYKPKYDFISQSQDEYFGGTYFHIEDQLNFNDMRPKIPQTDLSSPYHRRSLSQERDPGYFMLSNFSLSITGVRKPRAASSVSATRSNRKYVRPASLEPSPVVKLPREYRSYTPDYRSYLSEYRPFTPDFRSYTPDYRSYTPDYRSYTPDYRSQTREYRSYSPDLRSLPKTRSLTPDYYYEYRSRSQTPDYHDIEKLKQRSSSLAQELAKTRLQATGYKSSPERSVRQVSPVKPVRIPSPPRQKQAFVKPRSYSISVPRAEVKKFNRIVEDSRSLISNYERLDQRSRQSSVADIRSDPRFTTTPRGSGVSHTDIRSDPRFTTTPRGSAASHFDVYSDSGYSSTPRGSVSTQHGDLRLDPRFTSTPRGSTSHADVKSDPRFSGRRRSSVAMSPAERERLASISSIKSDARFSAHRRATIATNDDLKSKLDTLTSNLIVPKPKKKKSSRPTIKYKSSRGEGAF